MNSNSLKELAIKSPKRYKIAVAIAKGLNEGKQLKEIFLALGVNQNTGYAVANQLREQIAEMRHLQAGPEENPAQIAKEMLKKASPDLAQILIDIAKNPQSGARERRQASKDGLNLAGVGDEKGRDDGGLKDMKLVMAKIYKDCNFIQGKEETIEAEVVEEPQIPSEIQENDPQ
jgi:hypothetical protein